MYEPDMINILSIHPGERDGVNVIRQSPRHIPIDPNSPPEKALESTIAMHWHWQALARRLSGRGRERRQEGPPGDV